MTKEEQLAKIASADELIRKDDLDGAMKIVDDIMSNIDNDGEMLVKVYARRIIIDIGSKDYYSAQKIIDSTFKMLDQYDDTYSRAVYLYGKGLLLVNDLELSDAKQLIEEALVNFKKVDDRIGIMRTYGLLAETYEKHRRHVPAIDNYNRTIREAKLLDNKYYIAKSKQHQAQLFFRISKTNIDKSVALFDEAYNTFLSIQKNEEAMECLWEKTRALYYNNASLTIEQGIFDEVLAVLRKYNAKNVEKDLVDMCNFRNIPLKAMSTVVISDNLQEEVLRADDMYNRQFFDSALELYKDIKRKTEDERLSAQCLLGIARVLLVNCNSDDKAQNYIDKCISQFEKDEDYLRLGHCYNARVTLLIRQNRNCDNMDNITKALECYRKCGSKIDEADSLLDIVDTRLERGEFDGLTDIADSAYKIFEEQNNMRKMGRTLFYYGFIYCCIKDYNSANKYFEQGAKMSWKADDSYNMIKCFINYIKTGFIIKMDINKVKELLEEAQKLCYKYNRIEFLYDIDEFSQDINVKLDD